MFVNIHVIYIICMEEPGIAQEHFNLKCLRGNWVALKFIASIVYL